MEITHLLLSALLALVAEMLHHFPASSGLNHHHHHHARHRQHPQTEQAYDADLYDYQHTNPQSSLESDAVSHEYLSDWSSQEDWVKLTGRLQPPKCVEIPSNMTLCHGIGYQEMMLPNLLEHDSLSEVTQQAASWVPLTRINCHPDVKVFLCSLFAPVCLDRLIYPCRSLCEGVQAACVGRMKAYGFDWPDMLKCDKFPLDNDMCIKLIHDVKPDNNCSPCKHPLTYESIIDQFCRSDVAMKVGVKEFKTSQANMELVLRPKKTFFKHQGLHKNQVRALTPIIQGGATCNCETLNSTQESYLLMGNRRGDLLSVTFGIVWNRKDKEFKKGISAIRKGNTCEGIMNVISANSVDSQKRPNPGKDKKGKKQKTDKKDKNNATKSNNDSKGKNKKGKKDKAGNKNKKGKKGKGKGKGRKNTTKSSSPSPNTASRRERVSKSELEDRAMHNFMKAAN